MSDFNWDDFEGNDDELFGRNDDENNEDDRTQHLQKLHRLMFIDDIEKFPSQKIPLDPIEAEDLFGKLTNEDNRILTKLFDSNSVDITLSFLSNSSRTYPALLLPFFFL